MQDITQLEVRQTRIYTRDRLPILAFANTTSKSFLSKRLGGAEVQFTVPENRDTPEVFVTGVVYLADDENKPHTTKLIQINERPWI